MLEANNNFIEGTPVESADAKIAAAVDGQENEEKALHWHGCTRTLDTGDEKILSEELATNIFQSYRRDACPFDEQEIADSFESRYYSGLIYDGRARDDDGEELLVFQFFATLDEGERERTNYAVRLSALLDDPREPPDLRGAGRADHGESVLVRVAMARFDALFFNGNLPVWPWGHGGGVVSPDFVRQDEAFHALYLWMRFALITERLASVPVSRCYILENT